MKKIIEAPLTVNGFSRPGKELPEVRGIVIHYLGKAKQTAMEARDYFETLKGQDAMDAIPDRSASAHYIIDQTGEIIRCIPENEKAYHVGSEVYTDLARKVFGKYASDPKNISPNSCSIGIELAHIDDQGRFTVDTIESATGLCAYLCRKYKLDPATQILTHYEVVGWKKCPLLFVTKPALFEAFKADVKIKMKDEN